MDDSPRLARELALAVYRVTAAFPAEEPLRKKLREGALGIALGVQSGLPRRRGDDEESLDLHLHIEEMLTLLALAKPQGFVRKENFWVLARHYQELREAVSTREVKKKNQPDSHSAGALPPLAGLNQRQRKIIQHFRRGDTFQLRGVRAFFEGYSQKTLRNDLKELCHKGILNREGVGTASFYRVVGEGT